MAFCRNCGKKLKEGDRFCYNCGFPVSNETEEQGTVEEESMAGRKAEEKKKSEAAEGDSAEKGESGLYGKETTVLKSGSKKKRPFFLAAVVLGLAVIIIAGILLFGGGSGLGGDRTEYGQYSNEEVCFSLDYPKEYEMTEPDTNNVLITDCEEDGTVDFQVSVEYAYHTVSNSAIYSAEDFARQVESNPGVLTEWLGTEDVQITETAQVRFAERNGYSYDFTLSLDGDLHTGTLHIVDGDGAFGCYSYLAILNENSKKAELYRKQFAHMEESFQITGSVQAEGYQIYRYDEFDLQFMVRDDAIASTKEANGRIVIYPVDHVYTEASIWIGDTDYGEDEKSVEEVLERKCSYYLEKEQARYVSQPAAPGYGRYPYTGIDMQFYEDGEWFTLSVFTFVHDGRYWSIVMKSTDAYYDTVATAASDVLFSLKFGDGTEPAEKEDALQDAIAEIESQPGYVENGTWEALGAEDDFNGDGIREFLAVYERESQSGVEVAYDLWSLSEKGNIKLESGTLFQQLGGNAGSVGIVKSKGSVYLAVLRSEPSGDRFHTSALYTPWEANESSLGDASVYMESEGTYGSEEQGRYILGDTVVEFTEFNRKKEEFSDWVYKLDILQGAGNGVETLQDLKD